MKPTLYEGTKRLYAKPLTRGEYNNYRGWQNPADENPADEGYLVEYVDGGKANDSRHAGYISWSPKVIFERSYAPVPGTNLPPHQQRVVAEKADLDDRTSKLHAFLLDNPIFPTLPIQERYRLELQAELMGKLSDVLGQRIADFGATASPLEQEIQEKANTAPRVTPADVKAQIVGETFTVLPSGRVTVCELSLENGFTVRGESAVVCIENFDAAIGRQVARENAEGKVWELLGFRLRDKLAEQGA